MAKQKVKSGANVNDEANAEAAAAVKDQLANTAPSQDEVVPPTTEAATAVVAGQPVVFTMVLADDFDPNLAEAKIERVEKSENLSALLHLLQASARGLEWTYEYEKTNKETKEKESHTATAKAELVSAEFAFDSPLIEVFAFAGYKSKHVATIYPTEALYAKVAEDEAKEIAKLEALLAAKKAKKK